MDDALFEELQQSVQEAGRIRRGQAPPAREFRFAAPDVKAIRASTGLSQARFARLMGVSIKTLQSWEQGRRHPHGPSKALLTIFRTQPDLAVAALHNFNVHT